MFFYLSSKGSEAILLRKYPQWSIVSNLAAALSISLPLVEPANARDSFLFPLFFLTLQKLFFIKLFKEYGQKKIEKNHLTQNHHSNEKDGRNDLSIDSRMIVKYGGPAVVGEDHENSDHCVAKRVKVVGWVTIWHYQLTTVIGYWFVVIVQTNSVREQFHANYGKDEEKQG